MEPVMRPPIPKDELGRALFSDEEDPAIARLARDALTRLDGHDEGTPPAWTGTLAQAPKAPPALVEAALAEAAPGRNITVLAPRRPRRWPWGAGAMLAASLAGILLLRTPEPEPSPRQASSSPLQMAQMAETVQQVPPASPPQTTAPPAASPNPAPAHPGGKVVPAAQPTLAPGQPLAIHATPGLARALAAYRANPSDGGRDTLVAALVRAGLPQAQAGGIRRLALSPGLEAEGAALPARLSLRLDGRGGAFLSE